MILPRTSEALYLLQRIRDEAHRFAITYHRQKRSKSMVRSALDDIPGLGETRRKALLRAFGSLARIRQATVEQIAEVPGIGRHTARAIVDALAPTSPGGADATPGAVDPYTGEILDSADAPPSVTQAGTPAPSTTARATAPDPGPDATQTRGVPT